MKRNSFRLLISLVAVATIAGCDRSAPGEPEPSTYTRNGTGQAPAAALPRTASAGVTAAPAAGTMEATPALANAATREALSDAAITGKIKAAIGSDPGMTGSDISVNTAKGVVVLEGTVKTQDQTGIASAHAQRQDGVMRVDSHLAAVARQ